jgi:hypothetical protein
MGEAKRRKAAGGGGGSGANPVEAIRSLLTDLASDRQEYDFQAATLASHAADYANQPDRLRRYAKRVINARIMILLASSRMNTQVLLRTYLLDVETSNPFPLFLASRSQLELLSVVADAGKIIKANAGEHQEDFATRVQTVDEALITATHGTRSPRVKEFMSGVGVSRLRDTNSADLSVLNAKNVLTRLEKLSKSGTYPECMEDYERLCEYVHPNWGMNMLHVVASPISDKFLRFSLKSREPFERALSASAPTMARAAHGTLAAFHDLHPPFGDSEVAYFQRRVGPRPRCQTL